MPQSQMFRSLEHRNARLFFFGLSVSNIGSWIQMTAVSLLVYRITGKGKAGSRPSKRQPV